MAVKDLSLADADLTDADLDDVACELRGIVHRSQWDKILGIGKLIFRRFFNDDEAAWRERRRNNDWRSAPTVRSPSQR